MPDLTDRGRTFRSAIASFVGKKLQKKPKDENGNFAAAAASECEAWLAGAVKNVPKLYAATHVLKATHPKASGSDMYASALHMAGRDEVGTHSLGDVLDEDIIASTAAYLGASSFLRVEAEGRRFMDWIKDGDVDFGAALHTDPSMAQSWMTTLQQLAHAAGRPESHSLAKQVYWLTGEIATDDDHYHLLQPLFSSSLAHAVHDELQAARYGEANKLARQALRNATPHDVPCRSYPDLAARKLGGTKPQNISQLNSERGGMNYLLSSLPPIWKEQPARLKHLTSVFGDSYELRKAMKPALKALAELLKPDPAPIMETRVKREDIEQEIVAQLVIFAKTIHQRFPAGWTQGAELDRSEQLWLDPQRGESDEAFKVEYEADDWQDKVSERFANWLNAELRKAGGPLVAVGMPEARHWAKQAIEAVKETAA